MSEWELRRHCPKCGKFITNVVAHMGYNTTAYIAGPFIESVTATCKIHGTVDMGHAPWSWEDFDIEDAA